MAAVSPSQLLSPCLADQRNLAGWTIGATNTAYYDGQYLAGAEDVVVVTLNYRLGIFGFSGAPGLSPNVGLLDQRLAVEWVRDNIKGFGGNPAKIVIIGQSSGSVAVDYWSYAYVQDPIVSGFISHSGNAFSFPINSRELAEQHWYTASAYLGCGASGDIVACMRSQNVTAIKAAAATVKPPPNASQARSQPVFQPTPDNITVFADYTPLSYGGKFAKLPYLHGNNGNEAGYYKITAFAQNVTLNASSWDQFNLEDFTCPTSTESHNRAAYHVPIWRFRYCADWDNLRLYTNPSSGTYHGSDLEMVLGVSQHVSGLPESSAEKQLQAYMMRAWVAFADDPVNGLTKEVGWPKYDSAAATLVRLGYNNSPTADFVSPSLYDSPCSGLNLSFYGL